MQFILQNKKANYLYMHTTKQQYTQPHKHTTFYQPQRSVLGEATIAR